MKPFSKLNWRTIGTFSLPTSSRITRCLAFLCFSCRIRSSQNSGHAHYSKATELEYFSSLRVLPLHDVSHSCILVVSSSLLKIVDMHIIQKQPNANPNYRNVRTNISTNG